MESNESGEEEGRVDMKAIKKIWTITCHWDCRLGGSPSNGMARCDTAKSASKYPLFYLNGGISSPTVTINVGDYRRKRNERSHN